MSPLIGDISMCQGVIFVFDSRNNSYYWGTGSHSNLIYRQFNTESPKFYDKLVRVEANLYDGPGEFSVEGGMADDDQLALFKDKLLDKAGSPQRLAAYLKQFEDLEFEHSAVDYVLSRQGQDAFWALTGNSDDCDDDLVFADSLRNDAPYDSDEYRWRRTVYSFYLMVKGLAKKPLDDDDKILALLNKVDEKDADSIRKQAIDAFAKKVKELDYNDLVSGLIADVAYDVSDSITDEYTSIEYVWDNFESPVDQLEGKELTAYKKLLDAEVKRLRDAYEKRSGKTVSEELTEVDAFAKVVQDRNNIAENWLDSWDAEVAEKKATAKKKAKAKKKTSKR